VSPDTELFLAARPRAEPGEQRLRQVRKRIARYYFLTVAGVGLLSAGLLGFGQAGVVTNLLIGGAIVLGLMALVMTRVPSRGVATSVTVLGALSVAYIGIAAAELGWGVLAPGVGFMALHGAFVAALLGLGAGSFVGGSAIVVLLLLAGAQQLHWVPGVAGLPIWAAVAVQATVVACGVGGGWLVARALRRYVQTAELRREEFRGLLQITADAYWEMDPQYRLTALTRERAGGQPVDDLQAIGAVPWELPGFGCDPEVLDRVQADLGARQRFRDMPAQWQFGNGRTRHFMVSGEPRFDARGVFTGYWGVARDVTDDLRARQALAQTESRYHDLFASIPTPLVLHRDGRVIDANPAAVQMLGFRDLPTMVGADLLSLYEGGDSRERARRRMEGLQAAAPGEPLPVTEFRLVSRTGRRMMVRATGVTVASEGGNAVLSIYVDDTERQAAEQAVRRSEALLSHLVASSPDVITLTDLNTGRYAMVNQTFEAVTGWKADEVIGRTALECGVWAHSEDRDEFTRQVRNQGRVQDHAVTFRSRDGREIPMVVSGARFKMDRREYLVVNARDVTQTELTRLEREAILDNVSIGIALTRDQRFVMANKAFDAMLGWPDGSIIGQPGSIVWPSPEAYADIGQRIGPALARGEAIEIECEVRRRDGSQFLSRLAARAVDPSHPSRGGTIWTVEDITERRRMDEVLAGARDAAEAANRAKSAFLANTSHELRTPLNGLLGLAQLARNPQLDESKRGQYLVQIVESAQSLATIVSDILDLSKIEAGKLALEREPFDLPAVLTTVARGYRALAEERGLALDLDLDPSLGAVVGDAMRVRQILGNYLSNAIKFTFEGGVRVRVVREDADAVLLQVSDTGPGIDDTTRARLFQPFTQADESTTRRYGGTGLGLSICRELAGLMGGQVGVDSRPGEGSCFWARLPLPAASVEAAADARLPGSDDHLALRGAHVLVVDDNEINLMVAVAQLEQFGARVGQAADGRQALDAVATAAAADDPYDLVMMDLQMPQLSGYEVTRELRHRYPADVLPVIAHTAAALVSEREEALAAGMNDFLPKPTESQRLRLTVERWVRVRRAASSGGSTGT